MRYAIIKSGTVVNVVLADAATASNIASAAGGTAVESSTASPGDTYSGGVFTRPAPVSVVPGSITRRQARQALVLAGYSLSAVDGVIAALPEPQRTMSRIFWEDSNEFERSNATLNALAPALSISQAQLDALFVAGAAL